MGTALFPQGFWEQKIGSILVVPTNLWDKLFPQKLLEQQAVVSYWLFPQICRNSILFILLPLGEVNQAIVLDKLLVNFDQSDTVNTQINAKHTNWTHIPIDN